MGYQLPIVEHICLVKLCHGMLDRVSYDWALSTCSTRSVLGVRVNDSCKAENH